MAEVTSVYGSETAGPDDDPVTVTRAGAATGLTTELALCLAPDLHRSLMAMFAEYGVASIEEGVLKSLGLWRYLDRATHEGRQVVVLDPQHPQGPFDVVDLRSW
ncbi:hypothetical protein [Kineosporia sp. NBRC 101731]|uniref:hypothetical protein n=1 Tax=Kineosporia sp. NBRC 101731 TaxID=3032199 RepID=UPI0024A10657|nr:hypothetical protein [Kineosporia sp. NBRC 101731]GLY30011.1 hypothetical protein Kisp02_33760 [Kineosporia sp. NBRC 101731]